MKKLWTALRAQLRKLRIYLFVRVNPVGKCPACGHIASTMLFNKATKLLVRTCGICKAEWGLPPLVNPNDWMAK
jgi:transcription elongation factor Elf1